MFRFWGPTVQEIWKQVSEEIQAEYVDEGFWKGKKVVAKHGPWIITLDSYAISTGKTTIVFTRLRAPYVNPSHFSFRVCRRSWIQDLRKFFGAQDIVIGDEEFDRDFIIQGNDEEKVRKLFQNATIRQLIDDQPVIELNSIDDEGWFGKTFPEDTDELLYSVPGLLKDPERIKELFELFAQLLDQLCLIGGAVDVPPNVTLD